MQRVNAKDPILSLPYMNDIAKTWAVGWPRDDLRLSPWLADISILKTNGVKVYRVTGGYEVLTPDALLFKNRCEDKGVEGQWLEWDK